MKIRNWSKFQHFKDRRPPWIKLYRDLIDDPSYHALDAEAAKYLILIWLIASEDENQEGFLPDTKKLAFRLRISEQKLIKSILPSLCEWLIQDDINLISSRYHHDINMISTRYQSDTPETETETETEAETEAEAEAGQAPRPPSLSPADILVEWNSMAKRTGIPKASMTSSRRKSLKERLKDRQWRESFRDAIAAIPKIPFLTGSNDRGWRANIDWFIRPDSVAKTIEGVYGRVDPNHKTDLEFAIDMGFAKNETESE